MSRIDDINFINCLRKKDVWCNAKIISSDNISFSVHSAVMMTQSEFFRIVFQFGPNEGKKGTERTRVQVPCVDGATLELVVEFVYTGQIQIDRDNVWPLIRSADFLQIPSLLQKGLNFLNENMTFPTCVQLLKYTENKVFLPSVRNTVVDFALKNICEPRVPLSLRNTSIQQMSIDTLESLLSSNYLNTPHEELVWEAVITWTESNSTNNAESLAFLIKTVRFGYIRAQYIIQSILGHPLIMEIPQLISLIKNREQELEDWLLSDNPQEGPPESLEPRLPHTFILAVGGWVGLTPMQEIALYDPLANSWTRVESLECPEQTTFAYHGLVRVGDWLYMVGGTDMMPRGGSQDAIRCSRLNLKTLTWQKISDLRTQRNFVSCVELGGLIYAFGGRSHLHTRLSTAEVYDPKADTWRFITSMNTKRSDSGYAVLDNKIYAIGGFSGEEILQSAERYDPSTNSWEFIQSLNMKRSGLRCVALRGHVFAIGGYSGASRLALVERYDPTSDTWHIVQPMSTPRSNLGATVWRDYIIVTGGYGGGQTVTTTEIYDIFENRWYDLAHLPSPRSALNTICIEGELDLAKQLLGERRESASSAARRRDQLRPDFRRETTPYNTPLPEGHARINESSDERTPQIEWHFRFLDQHLLNNNILGNIEEADELDEPREDDIENSDWDEDNDSIS